MLLLEISMLYIKWLNLTNYKDAITVFNKRLTHLNKKTVANKIMLIKKL